MGELIGSIDAGFYSSLEDFRLDYEAEDGVFCFCFWVYFLDSSTFPAALIRQVDSDTKSSIPLLVLNEEKRLLLLAMLPEKEVLDVPNSSLWNAVPHALATNEVPVREWVHVGCQVSSEVLRLDVNGELMEEKPLAISAETGSDSSSLRKSCLLGDAVEGYLYRPMVLPSGMSVDVHYKDPPVHLTLDKSSASDIEIGNDGIWSIVGGKASCRRNFALDVVLLDAFGQTVDKEMEVVATLVYADTGMPVEKTIDADAPLLTTYDGLEFDSKERSSTLLKGRASFKLKISQLSSKCENKLFRIKFNILKAGNYPFLEALTPHIRSVSRGRNMRTSSLIIWKRPASSCLPSNGTLSSKYESSEIQHNTVREAKPSPSSKRVRLGRSDYSLEQLNMECSSHFGNAYQVKSGYETILDVEMKDSKAGNNPPSESESNDDRNLEQKNPTIAGKWISDFVIFKYCLGGLSEKVVMLKEISASATDKELLDFANQVSLYTGCSHHGNQIRMTKKLIEDGMRVWGLVAHENHQVHWDSAVSHICEQFVKITGCSTRSLTTQDVKLLRRIAGCQDYMTQENFQRLWCWLYPVALTISRDAVKAMWSCTSPKWIEGLVTLQEAESSLQGHMSLREPGTFVLHFPVSRSWPHPDAGSLVVTYVGGDYNLHHRLISLDHLCSCSEVQKGTRPLQEMLLMEPELSQLRRVVRS